MSMSFFMHKKIDFKCFKKFYITTFSFSIHENVFCKMQCKCIYLRVELHLDYCFFNQLIKNQENMTKLEVHCSSVFIRLLN